MVYTDDPVRDAEDYQIALEEEAKKWQPALCEWCGEPLDHDGDQYCYETEAHELICECCKEGYWDGLKEDWEKRRMRCVPFVYKE